MARIVVGPFNRVEGDLEVTLEVVDDRVQAAWVNSPMFRGFEQMLLTKHPLDALVYVPRICGICSVAQSAAAARALAAAAGSAALPNGQIMAALTLAIENLADHLTHFALFFMPDFARDTYADRAWHGAAVKRFKALEGSLRREVLPARARLLECMGVLAGKWPHTESLQPGGASRVLTPSDGLRVLERLRAFRDWLSVAMFGGAREAFAALSTPDELRRWAAHHGDADAAAFIAMADDLDLWQVGSSGQRFMSAGAYALPDGPWWPAGVWQGDAVCALDPTEVTEDVACSWLTGDAPQMPMRGQTWPQADKPNAYTWCKAPRWRGQTVEVGALARQVVAGHPLARALVASQGGSVAARIVARMIEMALLVDALPQWLQTLEFEAPFCAPYEAPRSGQGVGLVEAARGTLGHWLSVHDGRIANYQIVAPTTWNFSPRDGNGLAGPLERALVGAHAGVQVQHIVRSFDPCMVCTVH